MDNAAVIPIPVATLMRESNLNPDPTQYHSTFNILEEQRDYRTSLSLSTGYEMHVACEDFWVWSVGISCWRLYEVVSPNTI